MYIHARPGEHRTRASVWLAATDSPPVEAVGPDIEAVVGMVADELRVHRRVEHDLFRHTPYIDLQREEDQSNALHIHASRANRRAPLPAHTHTHKTRGLPAQTHKTQMAVHARRTSKSSSCCADKTYTGSAQSGVLHHGSLRSQDRGPPGSAQTA